MAAVIPGFTPENIRAFIEQSGLTVDLDQFNDLVANAQAISDELNEEFFNATPEEIINEFTRIIVEDGLLGRDLIVVPDFTVSKGEVFDLNGSIIAPIVLNEGTINADSELANNIFSGFLGNGGLGLINLGSGNDFVLAITGGIANNNEINTGLGSDLVSGTATGATVVDGIFNIGRIDTNKGRDTIVGNALGFDDVDGINNENAVISTGRGADLIDGEAAGRNGVAGINNDASEILTGRGNDQIIGFAEDINFDQDGSFVGIQNGGVSEESSALISTGEGNDLVQGAAVTEALNIAGVAIGINSRFSSIKLGNGDDQLIGTAEAAGSATAAGINSISSTINLGNGNNWVTGIAESQGGSLVLGIANQGSSLRSGGGNNVVIGDASGGVQTTGIFNTGEIRFDSGDDSLIGVAMGGTNNSGIGNFGTIKMRGGNDIVDALIGGFSGNGTTLLGGGDDDLIGFGTGLFNGGAGFDTIRLGTGVYEFDAETNTLVFGDTTMNLVDFEFLAGADTDSAFTDLTTGVFVINDVNQLVV